MNPEQPPKYQSKRLQLALRRAVHAGNLHPSLKPAMSQKDSALVDAMIGQYLDDAESHGARDSREFEYAQERVALLVDYLVGAREDDDVFAEVSKHPEYNRTLEPDIWLLYTISLGAKACSTLVDTHYELHSNAAKKFNKLETFLNSEQVASSPLFNDLQIAMLRASIFRDRKTQEELSYSDVNRACDSLTVLMDETDHVAATVRGISAQRLKVNERKFLRHVVELIQSANGPDKYAAYSSLINEMALHFKTDTTTQYKRCDAAIEAALDSIKYHLKTSRHARRAR